MKKEKQYSQKLILEFTPPKKKKVSVKATFSSINLDITFEGDIKEVKRVSKNKPSK